MRIDPRDPAFDPKVVWRRNLDVAVDPAALVFDRDVRPFDGDGSALLVPVDVQALSVPEDGAVDHADTSVRLVDAQELGDLAEATAAPFTEGAGRSAGIHLHWAMPDALTRGTTSESGVLSQPSLPDRWLVVRLGPGTERPWAGWVIESDYGRATPLSEWEGEPGDPDGDPPAGWIPPESLSAASGGDPAWAATFDNVVNRFAFHDPLTEVEGDLFTYVVVGWYGDDSLDPLDDVRSMGSFDHVMQSLGWTVSPEAHERARLEGLIRSNALATAGAEGRAFRKVANRRELAVGAAFDDLTVDALDSVWPRRCVFHGAVFGVRRDGVGADRRPTPHDLSAALGATATEALARLIGHRHPQGGAMEERALAAFAYGVADRLGEPDGPALVEEQMHGRAFESRPGPPLHDWIRRTDRLKDVRPKGIGKGIAASSDTMDDLVGIEHLTDAKRQALLERASASEAAPLEDVLDEMFDKAPTARGDVAWKARFDFLPDTDKDRIHEVGGVGAGKRLQAALREIDRIEKVARAGPRYYQPQDPVIAIQGSERHLRHGYDGRWTADETVACRLAGDTQDEWDDVTGAELLASPFVHAALPPEARHLVHEAALEDPSNVEETIAAAVRRDPTRADELAARIRAEIVIGRYGRDPERQTDVLAQGSSRHGTMSSGIGFNEWNGQPWIPLHLEWEVEVDVGDRLGGWELGELDFDPPSSIDADPTKVLAGRSLLSSASVKSLADEIRRTLEEQEWGDTENDLRRVAGSAEQMDVLSTGLAGIRDHLLGMPPNVVLQERPEDAPPLRGPGDEEPPPEPLPTLDALLSRAGLARLRRARLVDAFGRSVEVPGERLLVSDQLAVPPGVRLADEPDDPPAAGEPAPAPRMLLRPRINLPARLLLRLLDRDDDTVEVNVDQRPDMQRSPVAGWLVADHVDHAVEIFSPEGAPIGQLRRDMTVVPGEHGAVVWEGSPGRPGPTGVSPGELVTNRHVRALVQRLFERDVARRESARGADRESPLSALLRALDTTQWTTDPVTTIGWEFPASLVGRPLAVVRAHLTLEVLGDLDDPRWEDEPDAAARRKAAEDRLQSREFEVRLGSLTRVRDGLFGYFVDDDYWRIHPVHPAVLADALPSGPGRGYQQDADSASRFDPSDPANVEPVTDPYLAPDATITVRPGQTRMLTLLMDPGSSIHLTSGIVPRKQIALQRDWVADALTVLAPSFRIGPVLVDPNTVRMPRPAGMPGRQIWTRRDSPTSWRDDPIEAATQEARLPDIAHETQEGWIRLVYEEERDG